jgi:hypothetical protein
MDNEGRDGHISLMTNPPCLTREQMLADLDASDAEVDAGLFVPAEVVRQDLLDSLARMKAKHDQQQRRDTARRR